MFDSLKTGSQPQTKGSGASTEGIEKLFLAAFVISIFGAVATVKTLKSRPELYTGMPSKTRWLIGLGAVAGAIIIIKTGHLFALRLAYQFILYVVASWLVGFAAAWCSACLWLNEVIENRITVQTLSRSVGNSTQLSRLLLNDEAAPIGMSFKTNLPAVLPVLQRREHVIIAGATGQGKTTLMMTLLKHSFLHKHPVIIIDPKGELADIERMKAFARSLGRDDSEFRLFSLASPQTSARYNPIESGTPEQRKAKLMDGLDLKHEYYGAMASKYLGSILDIFEFLGVGPTLRNIEQALLSKSFLADLHKNLRDREQSNETRQLLDKVASIQKIDAKELAGLSAQIESFNSREFSTLLSPSKDDPSQIRLLDVLEKGQIAYFQMNVNGYGDIARRIGKLIIQDLKATSSLLQAGQSSVRVKFAPCFIDEFGSFATRDFADFLKQVRSANIGVHLLCQGMADLRAVSPEFEEQVLGNTVTKIVFRTDVSSDAEGWASMAGTMDAFDESFQVQRNLLWTERSGAGTQNPSKKMKVDFDVFKMLKRGQAVMIDKARGIEDVISIWDAKSEVITPQQIPKAANPVRPQATSIFISAGLRKVSAPPPNANNRPILKTQTTNPRQT